MATSVRRRLGLCIVHIEGIPAYANLMASMDPAYLNWVRASVGVPDMQVVSKILHRLQPAVSFDIPSTRHLIQRVISLVTRQSRDSSSGDDTSNGVTTKAQTQVQVQIELKVKV